jgi:hypothetical protein
MRSWGYWLSPSVLTRMSAPSSKERTTPSRKDRPRPWVRAWWTKWVTPCSRATATVRSVHPSSMTRISISSTPGTWRGMVARTEGSVRSSFKQGIWTISFTGPSLLVGTRTHPR